MAPQDAILGLMEAYGQDPNPEKINLSVGVYKDDQGRTPILDVVREAQQRVLQEESSKVYLAITGLPEYATAVQRLMFGPDHEIVTAGRATTAHTPGGTGALRVAGDFLKNQFPGATLWLSNPTWPNHPSVFAAAGVKTKTYPYFNTQDNSLALDEMLDVLRGAPYGDIVLLHACCQNPTGIDPTLDEWQQIADVLSERGLVPMVDFAYQGFADGVDEDAAGLRTICQKSKELIICSSFSKSFGLYRERVGALTIVCSSRDAAARTQSHIKRTIRSNYSTPPAYGGAVVTTVLTDEALTARWIGEVAQMRDRINSMRSLLAERLAAAGVARDFSFITEQRGMFSITGLTPEQTDALRENDSIYIVRSGRINIAGVTEANVDRLTKAIARVL